MAIPLILLGFIVKTPENTPLNLPASAIMFILPALVASILMGLQSGSSGIKWLWGQIQDKHPIKHWFVYLFALSVMPLLALIVYFILYLAGIEIGTSEITITSVLTLLAVYTIAATCEEVGWMGYVFGPMESKWSAIKASLILGVLWALLHIAPWIQVHGVTWTVGWVVFSIFVRIPMTFLYIRVGRTLAPTIVLHTMINVVVSIIPTFTTDIYLPYAFAAGIILLSLAVVATGSLQNKKRATKDKILANSN